MKDLMYRQWKFPENYEDSLTVEEVAEISGVCLVINRIGVSTKIYLTKDQWYLLCDLKYKVGFIGGPDA